MTEAHTQRIVAGDDAILSRRYATALYELAEDAKQLDVVAADLRSLRVISAESQEFQQITRHPRLTRAQLADSMKLVSAAAKLNSLTANFLHLLANNRRLTHLDMIIDAFMANLAAKRGEYTADVRTFSTLNPKQLEQLTAQLQAMAGGKVHLMIREDASLLGGLIVKLGSRFIDASIFGKLARLERQLKSQQEAA